MVDEHFSLTTQLCFLVQRCWVYIARELWCAGCPIGHIYLLSISSHLRSAPEKHIAVPWLCLDSVYDMCPSPLTTNLCYWGEVLGWPRSPLINTDLSSPIPPPMKTSTWSSLILTSTRHSAFCLTHHISQTYFNLRFIYVEKSLGLKCHHHDCKAGRGQGCEFSSHTPELHLITSAVGKERGKALGGRGRKCIFRAAEWGQGVGMREHSLAPLLG